MPLSTAEPLWLSHLTHLKEQGQFMLPLADLSAL